MPRYFRYNSLGQTLAEDLRLAPSWKVLVLWIRKLFRQRSGAGSPIPLPVPFHEYAVGAEGVSPEAAAQLTKPRSDAARLGFDLPVYQVIPTTSGEILATVANWRHTGGEILARVVHAQIRAVQPAKEVTTLTLISRFADGRRLVTTGSPHRLDPPTNAITQRLVNASFDDLLAAHRRKLDELRAAARVELIVDDAALASACDRLEIESMDHYAGRGLYEEVNPGEIAAEQTSLAPLPIPPDTSPEDAAVLAEIDKLQNKPVRNWSAALPWAFFSL